MVNEARIDLRSDTVTRPTLEMREAMARAEVGDDVLDGDPTVRRLEARVAELLGHDRALFFPSGIMANQAALMALTDSGTEALIDVGGHILRYEEAAASAWGGIQLRAVSTGDGHFTPEEVDAHTNPASPYLPRTTLLCLENTHNHAGGTILSPDRMEALREAAEAHGLSIHLDGARLWHAAAKLSVPPDRWSRHADSAMVSFSKGLGAPVGSALALGADRAERAWRIRRRLGGAMRQAGILAAAALHALDHHLDDLAADHRRASALSEALDTLPGIRAASPETNIVMIDLVEGERTAAEAADELRQAGVLVVPFGARRIRAVLHRDIDDGAADRASETMSAVLTRLT